MRIFKPQKVRTLVTDVTPELVRSMGCTAVAIDADNTICHDRTTTPFPGTVEWVVDMKLAGIPVILVSNGKEARAHLVADQYDIPVEGLAMKPLPNGYRNAAKKLGVPCSEVVMLGDQLFTDVLGGNLAGCKTIWVLPYEKDRQNKFYFAVKRAAEAVFKRFWQLTGSYKEMQQ